MSTVHLHLLLNHVPVLGVVFVTLLLCLALVRSSGELAKLSLASLALVGVISILVFVTGEPAQEAIEHLPGFSERLIDRHEDAALVATIAAGCIGAVALGALVVYRRRAVPRWLTLFALVAALGSTGLMGYVANLGGQIRHTEIRSTSATRGMPNSAARQEEPEER
ncbi:MAG TPA: hypothetical protein VJN70_13130 [Gemmatimonadaceae bacterium]|nr:hypothetical protein [Gemmatimonadaceae bacterium]